MKYYNSHFYTCASYENECCESWLPVNISKRYLCRNRRMLLQAICGYHNIIYSHGFTFFFKLSRMTAPYTQTNTYKNTTESSCIFFYTYAF